MPAFVASAPSVLEIMKRRDLGDAMRQRTNNADVGAAAAKLGFPLWLPVVLLALCAAFFGWLASMTASGSAQLQEQPPSAPGRLVPAAQAWPAPLSAVDKSLNASGLDGRPGAALVDATPDMEGKADNLASKADGLEVVAGFYRALAAGDGRAAASAVTPAKRGVPAFTEERMSRFYGSLREPLAMESLRPVAAHRFEARYSYRSSRTPCRATATVETEVIGERTFIRGIRATC